MEVKSTNWKSVGIGNAKIYWPGIATEHALCMADHVARHATIESHRALAHKCNKLPR